MIFTVFFWLFLAIVNLVLSLLPTGSAFPVEFTNGIRALWNTIWAWDFIFPVQTFINCVAIGVSFWTFVLIWHIVHWIIRKIPAFNIR